MGLSICLSTSELNSLSSVRWKQNGCLSPREAVINFTYYCWLQVVMDNSEEKAKQRVLDSESCFEKNKRGSAVG